EKWIGNNQSPARAEHPLRLRQWRDARASNRRSSRPGFYNPESAAASDPRRRSVSRCEQWSRGSSRSRPPAPRPYRKPVSVGSWFPDLLQCIQQPARLLARAHGDAHTARQFVAPVAYQDIPRAQRIADFDRPRAETPQHEIGRTRHIRDTQLL